MSNVQLYYPNISPEITSKFAVSLLHWDKVVRIFPKTVLDAAPFQSSLVGMLEAEGLLDSQQLNDDDISSTLDWFDKVISAYRDDVLCERKIVAETLVSPYNIKSRDNYYLFRGKTNIELSYRYKEFFTEATDRYGNDIYVCSQTTGLTYMTLMAYFLNKRSKYKTVITDRANALPLFIFLNNYFAFNEQQENVVLKIKESSRVERAFFLPLIPALEPEINNPGQIIEDIINLRKNQETEKIRKGYLAKIDLFLNELRACNNDIDAEEVTRSMEAKLNFERGLLVDACKANNIPVKTTLVNHTSHNTWSVIGEIMEAGFKLVELVHLKGLVVVKALVGVEPSFRKYDDMKKHSDDFYPLLIQEKVSPTSFQQKYHKIRQIHEHQKV